MSVISAILSSLGICVISAILEGILSGKDINSVFAKLKFPPYSAPLWIWYIIGVVYYAICSFILFRIFRRDDDALLKNFALALLLVMMGVNAFWNYVFFRLENLFLSFFAFAFYPLIAVSLFICLLQFDKTAGWAIVPYLFYLIYAIYWSYGLWKLNPKAK